MPGKRKPGGSTPTTIVRVRPELNRARHRLRIGSELRAPELVAHDRHRRARPAARRRPRSSRPSAGWTRSAAKASGVTTAPSTRSGSPCAEERGLEPAEPGQRLERPLACAQVDEVAERDVGLGQPGRDVAVPQHDELVGAVERQRPEQDRFDDGEERRVGADAQRRA